MPQQKAKAQRRRVEKIGQPGYKVVKQKDPDTEQKSLLFEIEYPQIAFKQKPKYRIMSAFEQRIDDEREDDDGQQGCEVLRDLESFLRAYDECAEPVGRQKHFRDDGEQQCRCDADAHAGHDLRQGIGQFDLEQFLHRRGAEGIRRFGKPGAVLFDVKGVLPRELVDGRL